MLSCDRLLPLSSQLESRWSQDALHNAEPARVYPLPARLLSPGGACTQPRVPPSLSFLYPFPPPSMPCFQYAGCLGVRKAAAIMLPAARTCLQRRHVCQLPYFRRKPPGVSPISTHAACSAWLQQLLGSSSMLMPPSLAARSPPGPRVPNLPFAAPRRTHVPPSPTHLLPKFRMLRLRGVDVDGALEERAARVQTAHHERALLRLAHNDQLGDVILVLLDRCQAFYQVADATHFGALQPRHGRPRVDADGLQVLGRLAALHGGALPDGYAADGRRGAAAAGREDALAEARVAREHGRGGLQLIQHVARLRGGGRAVLLETIGIHSVPVAIAASGWQISAARRGGELTG
eukprot:361614-Chlamydomonas_euryale.AAC.2